MKRNQNFDHNHSQKVFSCRYNMDTNRAEARFEDGTILSIDCMVSEMTSPSMLVRTRITGPVR